MKWTNMPLDDETRAALEDQARENGRSVAREGALIVSKAMRRRIARTQKQRKDEAE